MIKSVCEEKKKYIYFNFNTIFIVFKVLILEQIAENCGKEQSYIVQEVSEKIREVLSENKTSEYWY